MIIGPARNMFWHWVFKSSGFVRSIEDFTTLLDKSLSRMANKELDSRDPSGITGTDHYIRWRLHGICFWTQRTHDLRLSQQLLAAATELALGESSGTLAGEVVGDTLHHKHKKVRYWTAHHNIRNQITNREKPKDSWRDIQFNAHIQEICHENSPETVWEE